MSEARRMVRCCEVMDDLSGEKWNEGGGLLLLVLVGSELRTIALGCIWHLWAGLLGKDNVVAIEMGPAG